MEMKFKFFIIFFLMIPIYSFCNIYDYLSDLNKQTENYKAEIGILEKIINENLAQLEILANELKSIDEELMKLSELLKNVDSKGLSDMDKIILEEAEVAKYNSRISAMKDSFRNKIIWLYKYGADYPLQIIFSSDSFNQLYVRLQYLTKISNLRAKDFEKIKIDSYILEEKKKLLNLSGKDKSKYISDKRENQREILISKKEKEIAFDSLKTLDDNLYRQRDRITNMISLNDSIARTTSKNITYDIYFSPDYKDTPIKNLKGKLIYPVKSIFILSNFGKNIEPIHKTLSYNNGIDFSIAKGSEVKAVANGTVEYIWDMPVYGKVLVINHGDYFYSFYGIVEKIIVTVGQNIYAGQIIAATSENLDCQSFHFELRENGIPLDPNQWIKW